MTVYALIYCHDGGDDAYIMAVYAKYDDAEDDLKKYKEEEVKVRLTEAGHMRRYFEIQHFTVVGT